VKYTMTTPCAECPFLKSMARGFTIKRLREFADEGAFPCHKACDADDDSGEFVARDDNTPACAGALIFNEKRNRPNQMMRIAERLGMYDRTKLNMEAPVR
jgi:hypothetical protein